MSQADQELTCEWRPLEKSVTRKARSARQKGRKVGKPSVLELVPRFVNHLQIPGSSPVPASQKQLLNLPGYFTPEPDPAQVKLQLSPPTGPKSTYFRAAPRSIEGDGQRCFVPTEGLLLGVKRTSSARPARSESDPTRTSNHRLMLQHRWRFSALSGSRLGR
jgi:hypothetical protein